MKTVVVRTSDKTLAALCTAELSALQLKVRTVSPEGAIPRDGAVLLVDLDTCPLPPEGENDLPLIGISRKEHELPDGIRLRLAVLLHRPFPITALRATVLSYLSQGDRVASPAEKQVPHPAERRDPQKREPSALGFDAVRRVILLNETEIPLTPSEAVVFEALYRAEGAPVSKEALCSLLGAEGESNLLRVHVCAIRKKLAPYGKDVLLHTLRGKGFCLLRIQ